MFTMEQYFAQMKAESEGNLTRQKYNDRNKYHDGNIVRSLINTQSVYSGPDFFMKASIYKSIAMASLSITNPISYPEVINPFAHNIALIPFAAGSVAASIPNMYAPIDPIAGATTTSRKIIRGEDTLKSLYSGVNYVRPTIAPPFYRIIYGGYSLTNQPPYHDVSITIPIPVYANKSTTNIYNNEMRSFDSKVYSYHEQAKKDNGQIDYSKLFNDTVGNKFYQKPIASIRVDKYTAASRFFDKMSAKMSDNEGGASNLNGVLYFDTVYGTPYLEISQVDGIYFPMLIADVRTKHGIILRPLSEGDIIKESFNIATDEDNYIGRVGTIYKYKNTSRKLTLNFVILADSDDDLNYMNGKVNFLKNLIYPSYRQFTRNISDVDVVTNLINTAPIVEIRFGNYIYEIDGNSMFNGAIGTILSFDADPFRFNWEIEPGKQIPQGFKISMEIGVINRKNPGVRILDDGEIVYDKFVNIDGGA